MRILFVHQAFHPDPAGAARVLYDLSRELVRRGHEVTVLTANRVYSTAAPLGPSDVDGGVSVRRIPVLGSRRSKAARLLSMLSFTAGALRQIGRFSQNHDVVVVSTLPPFLAAPAARLVRRAGRVFIYLCHDIYPDILGSNGYPNGLLGRVISAFLERQTVLSLNRATKIIVLSTSMRDAVLRKKAGILDKVEVIANFADPARIRPVPRQNRWAEEHGLVGKRVVMYAGNMGPSHNLEVLLEAARRATDPDLAFVFVGGGAKQPLLERKAAQMGLANVRFLPFQPDHVLSDMLGTAFVSVVALEPELDGLAVPSKLYSIMASARPVLVLQPPEAELARMVQNLEIGYAASDSQSVLDVMDRLSNSDVWTQVGTHAYDTFRRHFSVEAACDAYERVFLGALHSEKEAPRTNPTVPGVRRGR